MRKLLASILAAVAVPFAAQASPSKAVPVAPPSSSATSPYYATAKLGVYVPQADDMDSVGFNNGFASEVQLGRRFHPNFAAELGVGWFSSSTDEVAGSKAELSVIPLTATAKAILPLGKVDLYGAGGVGMYLSDIKLRSPIGTISDDDSSFGLHLGAGAQYSITNQLSLGIETRYLIAKVNEANMDGFMLNGGVAFSF